MVRLAHHERTKLRRRRQSKDRGRRTGWRKTLSGRVVTYPPRAWVLIPSAAATHKHGRCESEMQQPETTLIYWAPSRVRFNLTLILAVVVVALGLLQAAGFDPLAAACSPRTSSESSAEGGQAEGSETDTSSGGGSGSAWLLVIVGLGVGAYSWLTGPRQYRVYSDALIIMFGTPRRRTIHFSDIREVVLDRGFMGDPLRVYTVNRRRVPLQVREPEELHQYLDGAVKEFWRANPQYAPPPPGEEDGESASDVVDSTAAEAEPQADQPQASEPQAETPRESPAEDPPRRSPRSRRRSLRDDSGGDGDEDRPPRFS